MKAQTHPDHYVTIWYIIENLTKKMTCDSVIRIHSGISFGNLFSTTKSPRNVLDGFTSPFAVGNPSATAILWAFDTSQRDKKRSSESVWDSWRKVTWEVQGLWIWMNINEDEWNMKECGSLALWNYDMTLYMASEKSTAMGRDESLQSQRNRPSKRPGLKRQVICKSYQQMYVHDLISISLWFCLYVTSGAYQWLVKKQYWNCTTT